MSDDKAAEAQRQGAERQRRHRARMTPGAQAQERGKTAERKRRRRASPEYKALPPERRWKEKGRRGLPPALRPFVGVDGEAGYVHNPWCNRSGSGWCDCPQYYAALTVGTQTLSHPDGRPLTTWQILDFLTAQPKDARYVGFFFDYDATHMLRGLPADVLHDLVHPERMAYRRPDNMVFVQDPASGRRYGLRWVPHKFLTVTRCGDPVLDADGEPQCNSRGQPKLMNGRMIKIHDCSGYWQRSFLDVVTTWEIGTPAERAVIAEWKSRRNDFTLPLPVDVITYNVLECKLLAELMAKLDRVASELGLRLRAYHGAGTLADALLEKHGIADFRGEPESRPPPLCHAIDCAFFGGRFDSALVGVVETLHLWDIASAYPAEMVTLPCLRHGRWEHHDTVADADALANSTVVRTRWDVMPSAQRPFGPLPYRREDGELLYPLSGEGWYWVEEVRAAAEYSGTDSFQLLEAWEWAQSCDHQPFAWVPDRYATRLQLGKNSAGMVLKYALNSLYGKTAQTQGGGGKYTEFVWAGMVTARTRAKLLDVASLAAEHAVMFATDGVGFDQLPPALADVATHRENPPLGVWEYNPDDGGVRTNVLMVQSGLYVDGARLKGTASPASRTTASPRDRARGIGVRVLEAMRGVERLYEGFRVRGVDARVPFGPAYVVPGQPVPMLFLGLRTAMHRGKLEIAGTWVPVDKTVSFAPEPKRDRTPQRRGESFVRTVPPMNGAKPSRLGVRPLVTQLSAPYRRVPRKANEKDLYYDQPDHVDGLSHLLGEGG